MIILTSLFLVQVVQRQTHIALINVVYQIQCIDIDKKI